MKSSGISRGFLEISWNIFRKLYASSQIDKLISPYLHITWRPINYLNDLNVWNSLQNNDIFVHNHNFNTKISHRLLLIGFQPYIREVIINCKTLTGDFHNSHLASIYDSGVWTISFGSSIHLRYSRQNIPQPKWPHRSHITGLREIDQGFGCYRRMLHCDANKFTGQSFAKQYHHWLRLNFENINGRWILRPFYLVSEI